MCERQKWNSGPQRAAAPFAHSTKLSGKLSKFKFMLFLWVTLHYQACNSVSLVLLIAGLGIMHFMWTLLLNSLEVAIYIPVVGCPILTSFLYITLLWKRDPVMYRVFVTYYLLPWLLKHRGLRPPFYLLIGSRKVTCLVIMPYCKIWFILTFDISQFTTFLSIQGDFLSSGVSLCRFCLLLPYCSLFSHISL